MYASQFYTFYVVMSLSNVVKKTNAVLVIMHHYINSLSRVVNVLNPLAADPAVLLDTTE